MPTKKTTKTTNNEANINDTKIIDNVENVNETEDIVEVKKPKREFKDTDRVLISNNRNWNLDFVSIEHDKMDITIPAAVKHWKKLTVAEVQGQIQMENTFFVGIDGRGNNAAIEIEDKEMRDYLFHLEGDEGDDMIVLNVESVRNLLAIENKAEYEKRLKELVVTESDKKMIVPLAFEAGIDNVASYKITMIEKMSGFKFYK